MTEQELIDTLSEMVTNNPELADSHVYFEIDNEVDTFYSLIGCEVDNDGDLIIIGED